MDMITICEIGMFVSASIAILGMLFIAVIWISECVEKIKYDYDNNILWDDWKDMEEED